MKGLVRPPPQHKPSQRMLAATALAGIGVGVLAYTRLNDRPKLLHPHTPAAEKLVQGCSSLVQGYRPPLLLSNTHVQCALIVLWQQLRPRRHAMVYERERVALADGAEGEVWFGDLDGETPPLSKEAPIVAVLHSLTAEESEHNHVTAVIRKNGFRPVVLVRPCHGEHPPKAARFNIIGRADDTKTQLERVREKYPKAPVFALGLSAGTGTLVRYLGESKEDTPVQAAVAINPGYDTSVCFKRMQLGLFGLYDWYLIKGVKDFFMARHEKIMRSQRPRAYEAAMKAKNFDEFVKVAYEFEGYASFEEYLERTNPILVADDIARPLLVFSSGDDPVLHVSNATDNAHIFANKDRPPRILAVTERGSHTAYFEALLPESSWALRCALEFFQHHHIQ
mmetsp:Transcript_17146/g.56112  ORF Transcript_17146/g.56112 Transcript_17146/m.56112 type:complete len:394 (-) Transcript_17146:115-1296(-)